MTRHGLGQLNEDKLWKMCRLDHGRKYVLISCGTLFTLWRDMHSCRYLVNGTLLSHSCGILLSHSCEHPCRTLVGQSFRTLVGHTCRTLVGQSFRTPVALSWETLVNSCHSGGTLLSHSCGTLLSHSGETLLSLSCGTISLLIIPMMYPGLYMRKIHYRMKAFFGVQAVINR
jgi:hypothetical protein